MSYIKKIITIIALVGILVGGFFAYSIYKAVFNPNTGFTNEKACIYIKSTANFDDVKEQLMPLLLSLDDFITVAQKKGYASNIKAGKFCIKKGMNNNEIVNTLRSANNAVRLSFNNQERIENLAGRVAMQIEADSVSLLKSFNDASFLAKNGFSSDTKLAMYIPNSYEVFWNTSADRFRDKMLQEYKRFWNKERLAKAKKINLSPEEVISLAAIVHKETVKIDERPRVAGVYLNRLKKGMLLQADPTVIYALKLKNGDFNRVYKRVLNKDLLLASKYNTYQNAGVPPGPIMMPDISAIDAVLNAESHSYFYFVANVTNFGYHKFAKTLAQHNANARAYHAWVNKMGINR